MDPAPHRRARRSDPYAPYVTDSRRRAPGAARRVVVVIVLAVVLAALVLAVVIRWNAVAAEGQRTVQENPAPAVTIPPDTVTPAPAKTPKRRVTSSPTPTRTP